LKIFAVADHLQIIFLLFLSLHVTLFSFTSVLPPGPNTLSLFLLFLSLNFHMMKIVAVAATLPGRLGLKMPENISSSNCFSVWSLLPLVNPLVEFLHQALHKWPPNVRGCEGG
jgi:hypothetical protein